MAHFHRLIVFCLLAVLSIAAYAYPATPVAGYTYSIDAGQFDSPGAAVADWVARTNSNQYSCCTVVAGSASADGSWSYSRFFRSDPNHELQGPFPQQMGVQAATVYQCPGGGNLSGSSCSCVAPQVDSASNNACVDPVKPQLTPCEAVATGLNTSGIELEYTGAPRSSTCYGGFVIRSSVTLCAGTKCDMFGPYQCGGLSCAGNGGGGLTGDLADNPAPSPCPKGKISGEVNGTTVCLSPTQGNTYQTAGSSGTQTTVVTAPGSNGYTSPNGQPCSETYPGSGSAQTTGIPSYPCTPNPPNGSPITSTSVVTATKAPPSTTTCDAFNCTVTTQVTSTNSAGQTTTVKTTDTSTKDDYCTKVPKSPLCVTSSYSSGSCDVEPVCGGDVVQCAQAITSFKTYCSIKKLDSTAGYGQPALDAATGTNPSDHPANNKASVSVGVFDKTNPYSAICPNDLSISPGGGIPSFSVPLSSFCSVFQLMGSLMVGLSLLGSAMFVVRGS